MQGSQDYKRASMKDMPVEFFLPPATNAALWAETAKLVVGCMAFILMLASIVTFTQGIVIKV
ncbi:hypothetical protein JMUB5695_00900 [Mycobacterium heckeshornense]|uniref:Uncharacterized protein n=3 Tax=Mycobacterium TaxID=1763 RepID=A0A2I3EY13_9MYCO|nr:hypothetical protein [Mycobacterium heckeshornense]KMV24309.1 hypothetical protein ACT16_02530 [Mycobacterium heckeshornense]BCO34342.1 hypothetical protein MHEC_07750 [Mycobacterium heckeshornense]BCQ07479.1 hypothetical protein JMUB5695_00900 [Mycobacterium heckeshornense]